MASKKNAPKKSASKPAKRPAAKKPAAKAKPAPRKAAAPEFGLDKFMELNMSYMPSRIVATAVQLGVFSAIGSGAKTAAEVADATGASSRGTRILLDAATGLGLLSKRGDRYACSPLAARHLVRDGEDYVGGLMETDALWKSWGNLTEVVRTGKPPVAVDRQNTAEQFFPILVRSLHITNAAHAKKTAQLLGAGKQHKGLRVLDVACGSGIWGIGVAEADRKARVTFQDFPGVLKETERYVKRHDLEARSEYLPGNLRDVDFGAERFDVALLGNIVHSEGEAPSRELFKKLHRALAPGGRVVVIDMIPNEQRSGPPFALMFAVNMLVNTTDGDCYTLKEYTAWLKEAGFGKVETPDIGSHSPLVVGVKAGGGSRKSPALKPMKLKRRP